MPKNRNYTDKQLAWLKKHRAILRNPELTDKFNAKFNTHATHGAIVALCNRNGWHCQLKRGREVGHTPWNKGKKTGIVPSGAFKKGHINQNAASIGAEVRRGRDPFIKIARTGDVSKDYVLKRRYLYEKHIGKIPDGFVIRHKDGNHENYALDNLEAISKRENVLLNKLGFENEPDELKPVLREFIRLKSKIHELEENINP